MKNLTLILSLIYPIPTPPITLLVSCTYLKVSLFNNNKKFLYAIAVLKLS